MIAIINERHEIKYAKHVETKKLEKMLKFLCLLREKFKYYIGT